MTRPIRWAATATGSPTGHFRKADPGAAVRLLESYDRIVGLVLGELAVDGCITKGPGGGECVGPSPVDRRKLGMKRSSMTDGYGIR
jgi:hypothetical protein